MMEMSLNRILNVDVLQGLKSLPDASIDCVMTSPPYWALRSYNTDPQVWDGKEGCAHEWGEQGNSEANTSLNEGFNERWGNSAGEKKQEKGGSRTLSNGCFCRLCGVWKGELGLEPTFDLYLQHLLQIFDDVKRVLKPSGTCFVNMGDTYSNSGGAGSQYDELMGSGKHKPGTEGMKKYGGHSVVSLPPKSLCMIPYRFAILMQERNWVLRNTLIWKKVNCMPSSTKDKFTIDFEPLFMFSKTSETQYWTHPKTMRLVSKQPAGTSGVEGEDWRWVKHTRCNGGGCDDCTNGKVKRSFWTGHNYFFDVNAIKEPQKEKSIERLKRGWNGDGERGFPGGVQNHFKNYFGKSEEQVAAIAAAGRAPRAVWEINTQPFAADHFAKYPEELCRRPILAGCPEFICKKCGKPRERIAKPSPEYEKHLGRSWHDHQNDESMGFGHQTRGFSDRKASIAADYETVGFSDCGCNVGWEKGVILDPFAGVGTTLKVAKRYGRSFIGFEIKKEYCEIAEKYLAGAENWHFKEAKKNKPLEAFV